MSDFATLRHRMVEQQIAARGVRDERVLEAMRGVPREEFVAKELRDSAYDDGPLPIECGQTISQPFIVAVMAEALLLKGGPAANGPTEAVLEIGTGSGYSTAVLARLARQVDTVERHPLLAEHAAARLRGLGCHNVRVHCGDGTLGWPEYAPYDAIVVTAGGPRVPRALLDQLAPGGRLVMPVGDRETEQLLVRLTRVIDGQWREERLGEVRFIPLIGAQGWEGS